MKKILSVILTLLFVLSAFVPSTLAATETAAVGDSLVKSVSDPETSEAYKNIFGKEEADGRVWVDKSVKAGESDADFDITLSAMSQEYLLNDEERSELFSAEGADVLMILDFSGSMGWGFNGDYDSSTPYRIKAMTDAVNEVMYQIMTANKKNRIMISYFTDRAGTILPLGRYATKDAGGNYVIPKEYFECSGSTFRIKRTSGSAIKIYNMDTGDQFTFRGRSADGGTLSQYGIAYGCNAFVEAMQDADKTMQDADKTTELDVQRTPFVLFMTDGDANDAANEWELVDDGEDARSNKEKIAALTILTAAYRKDQIINAYNERNQKYEYYRRLEDIDWFNVGVALKPVSGTPTWMQVMMNPNLTQTTGSGTAKDVHDSIVANVANRSKSKPELNVYSSPDRYRYTNGEYVTYAQIASEVVGAFTKLGEVVSALTGGTVIPIVKSKVHTEDDGIFIDFEDTIGTGMELQKTDGVYDISMTLSDGKTYKGSVKSGNVYQFSNGTTTLKSTAVIDGEKVEWKIHSDELPIVRFASRAKPGTIAGEGSQYPGYLYEPMFDKAGAPIKTPIRLNYTVKPTEEGTKGLDAKNRYLYSNLWEGKGNGTTVAGFTPAATNSYYPSNKTESENKSANTTATAATLLSGKWIGTTNKEYEVTLGNNGRDELVAKIVLSGPTEASVGDPLEYTITVTNLSGEAMNDVVVTANLTGTTIQSSDVEPDTGKKNQWTLDLASDGTPTVIKVTTTATTASETGHTESATMTVGGKTIESTVTLTVDDGSVVTIKTKLDGDLTDIGDVVPGAKVYLKGEDGTLYEMAKDSDGVYTSVEKILDGTYEIVYGTDEEHIVSTGVTIEVQKDAENVAELDFVKPTVLTNLDDEPTDIGGITKDEKLYLDNGTEVIELVRKETGVYASATAILAKEEAVTYSVMNGTDDGAKTYGAVEVGIGKENAATLDWYTVAFDENGHGTKPDTQIVAKGDKATAPTISDPAGEYSFVNWYTDDTLATEFDFTAAITEPKEAVAKWKLNNIPVSYPEYTEGTMPTDQDTTVPNGAKILVDPNQHGTYEGVKTIKEITATDEDGYTIAPCVADEGWIFAGYVKTKISDDTVMFTAQYYEDSIGGDDGGSDDVPDCFEKKLTYTITNGTWDEAGTDSEDIVEYVELKKDGVWSADGTGTPAKAPEATYPAKDYTQSSAVWTKGGEAAELPTEVSGTDPEQYDCTYGTRNTYDLTYREEGKPKDPKTSVDVPYGATVTVDPAGGEYSGETSFRMSDEDGDQPGYEVPDPIRENYVFNGWKIYVAENGDVTLTASWLVKPVVVTRLNDAETDIDKITGDIKLYIGADRIKLERTDKGTYVSIEAIPVPASATDYVIYNSAETAAKQYGKVVVSDGGENTAYLDWYTVAFDENGHGTKPDTQTVPKNGLAVEPPMSDSTGEYSFVKWYTDDTFTTPFDFTAPITEQKEAVAKWKLNNIPVSYPEYTEGTMPTDQDMTVPNGAKILVDPNQHGTYEGVKTVKEIIATDEDGYTIAPCVADEGWIFAGYVVSYPEPNTVLYTAQYYEDSIGGDDGGSDDVPDCFEKKLTYTITNGTWDEAGTDSEDIVEYVELKKDGVWSADGTGTPAKAPEATYPEKAYTQSSGEWTKGGEKANLPTEVSGTDPEQYDYTYGTMNTYDLTYREANKPDKPKKTDDVRYGATVTVDPAGGEYSGETSFMMTDEEGDKSSYEVPDPTREHYVFNGWEKSVDENGNVTLVALWIEDIKGELPKYNGPDEDGDPEGPPTGEELEVEPGQGIYVVPHPDLDDTGAYHVQINEIGDYSDIVEPKEDGKVFVGWEIDETYYEEFTPDEGDPYECVVKLTAKYADDVLGDPSDPDGDGSDGVPDCFQKPVTYTVVNGDWSDKKTDPEDVKTEYVTLRDPEGNWSKAGVGYLTVPDAIYAEPDEAHTADGAWDDETPFPEDNAVSGLEKENFNYVFGTVKTYTVKFDVNGLMDPDPDGTDEKKIDDVTKTHDVDVELTDGEYNPERIGFTFGGWMINGDEEKLLAPGEPYTDNADATLVALWLRNAHDITYPEVPDPAEEGEEPEEAEKKDVPYGTTLIFDPNGGTFRGSTEITEIPMPDDDFDVEDPVREGYTFNGWLIDDDESHPEWIKFIAQWVEDKTVEFEAFIDEEPEDGEPDEAPETEEIVVPYKAYILIDPNGGFYNGSQDPTLLFVTKDFTGLDKINDPIPPFGGVPQVFVGWEVKEAGTYMETEYVYELEARYEDDTNGDDIADVFEKKLTYLVVNGTWDEWGSAQPKTEWIPLYDGDKLSAKGVGEAKLFPTGMIPLTDYTEDDAAWSPEKPADLTKITKDTPDTFTYTFPKIVTVTFDEYQEPGPAEPVETETETNETRTITINPNGGVYNGHNKPYTEPLTDDVVLGEPVPPANKVFVGWEETVDEKGNLTYTAQYLDDHFGDPNDPDNKGDGIPDVFQKRLEFRIVNGTWDDAESRGRENRVKYVTLYKDGKMNPAGSGRISFPTGMDPDNGFFADRSEAEGWNPVKTSNPMVIYADSPELYVFTFHGVNIYFTDDNGGDPIPSVQPMDWDKKLIIDPNGGVYRFSKDKTVIDPVGGSQNVGEPTPPSGYEFVGWHYSRDLDGNVTLTAVYRKTETPPKTGDAARRGLWIAMSVAFAGGLTYFVVSGVRKRKNEK